MIKNTSLLIVLFSIWVLGSCSGRKSESAVIPKKPNILFVIADDQSFPHNSAYGAKSINTPGFDKVAEAGVLFANAFVAAP